MTNDRPTGWLKALAEFARAPWVGRLGAGFDTCVATVALWEGVVSYLTPAAVDQNLRTLARMLAEGSELILSYVHSGALDGSVAFREAQRWKARVRSSGEPFIFGFDPAALANLVAAARLQAGERCVHRGGGEAS